MGRKLPLVSQGWIEVKIDSSFLPRQWRPRVRGESKSELHHRRNLEIAVCFALAKALKSGDIYVPGSCSYGAYTERLYPIETKPQVVADYLRDRDLPPNGEQFRSKLQGWLSRAISGLEQMARDEPIVSRQSSSGQPDSATELEQNIIDRLPPRTILEALHNTDRWTRWTQQFGPTCAYRPPTRQAIATLHTDQFRLRLRFGPHPSLTPLQRTCSTSFTDLCKPTTHRCQYAKGGIQ
jgi:hypothetical protein